MTFKISSAEVKKIRDFLETPGKKLLFYHRDSDGVCSAVQILRFFSGFSVELMEGPRIEKELVERLIGEKPELIVFLDMSIDQNWDIFKEAVKRLPKTRILIIDHHLFEKNLNSKNIIHINPRFQKKDIYLATSYLVYKILEKMNLKVKPYIWIAAMGVIGDYAFEECKDLLRECKKLYPKLIKTKALESGIVDGINLISAAITLKGSYGAGKAFGILLEANVYEDFSENKGLQSWKSVVEKEFKKILEDFEMNRRLYPEINLIIYEIISKLNLTSALSTALAEKNPDKTILIRKKSNGYWKISLRNQSGKINLGDLVKKCVEGIGQGGGHEKSAGAIITKWGDFKERFVRELEKMAK